MKQKYTSLKYALYIAVGLISYFLFLSIWGLHIHPVYSILNLIIMSTGMFLMIKNYKKEKGTYFNYQKGFWAIFRCGMMATFIFTAFFALYSAINPLFVEELIPMWEAEYFANIGDLIFTVALMGFATSITLSLTYMQLFKRSWNTKEGNDHTY